MRPVTRSAIRSALILLIPILLIPLQSSRAQSACTYSLGGCQCNCDGLPCLPPQNPPARSYDSFIIKAYQGAYGRNPTCFERQNEYWNLVSSSALLEEAKRFVSTLFETQQSYDTPGIDPCGYTQTPEYEQRRPNCRCTGATCSCPAAPDCDRVATEAFVGDLYKAFLQRSPDLAGQCFWSNNVCSEGRKKGIEAFKVSIEFGNLVNGLFDSGEPCSIDSCKPWICP